jgi:hypothetical protein
MWRSTEEAIMRIHAPAGGRGRCSVLIPALAILLTVVRPAPARPRAEQEKELDGERARRVIETVLEAYETHYVYPDLALRMSAHVRERWRQGAYADVATLAELTRLLRQDLREVSSDRHIWVDVKSPADLTPAIGEKAPTALIAERARENFGFRRLEHLAGNVGYLKLDRFDDAVYAGDTATAAMNVLGHCDAVIIDLRENHGGHDTMVRLLASYFFAEPRLLGSLYFTRADSLEQAWTQAHVPGPRLDRADLYILTSRVTASGAEAFSYGLKHLGRALIVGEQTRGAAHWSEDYDFPDLQVRATVPIARPINPVTGTSWEGTGVEPDIAVPAARAPAAAHREALERLIARCSDERCLRTLRWAVAGIEAAWGAVGLTEETMQECAGLYGDGRFSIQLKGDHLSWTNSNGTEYVLVPLARDLFGFEDGDDYRLQVIRDERGAVTGYRLLERDGAAHPIRTRSGDLD